MHNTYEHNTINFLHLHRTGFFTWCVGCVLLLGFQTRPAGKEAGPEGESTKGLSNEAFEQLLSQIGQMHRDARPWLMSAWLLCKS